MTKHERQIKAMKYSAKVEKHWRRVQTLLYIAAVALGIGLGSLYIAIRLTTSAVAMEPVESPTEAVMEVSEIAYVEEEDPLETVHIEEALVNTGYLIPDIGMSFEDQEVLHAACDEFGVPFEVALGVCWSESGFEDLRVEHAGRHYFGPMAVQLESAGRFMDICNVETIDNKVACTRVGCSILGTYIETYGDLSMALMAYHRGPGGAAKLWNDGIYTDKYSQKVLAYADNLKGE